MIIVTMNPRESPTIWSAYVKYLTTGQQYRIPFEDALSAWNKDAKRWAFRNTYIPDHRAHTSHTGHNIRVASWNVHQWRMADGTPTNANKLADDLFMINADVLCLQEYTPMGAPADMLTEHYPYSTVETLYHHDGGFGNAIFSKFPIISQRVIELPTTAPIFERRVCMHVELGKLGKFHVFNTHLEVRNDYPDVHKYRYPQLFRIIEEIKTTPGRVILCGDFNTGWNSETDRLLHRELTNTGNRNVGAWARQARQARLVHTTNMTRNTSIYGGFVDHIYTRNIQTRGFYELFTNASDHYPIMADLVV